MGNIDTYNQPPKHEEYPAWHDVEQLYFLPDDPNEVTNLIDDSSLASTVELMRS